MQKVFKLKISEILYGYWGMEFSCKIQELDPAPETKKAKLPKIKLLS